MYISTPRDELNGNIMLAKCPLKMQCLVYTKKHMTMLYEYSHSCTMNSCYKSVPKTLSVRALTAYQQKRGIENTLLQAVCLVLVYHDTARIVSVGGKWHNSLPFLYHGSGFEKDTSEDALDIHEDPAHVFFGFPSTLCQYDAKGVLCSVNQFTSQHTKIPRVITEQSIPMLQTTFSRSLQYSLDSSVFVCVHDDNRITSYDEHTLRVRHRPT